MSSETLGALAEADRADRLRLLKRPAEAVGLLQQALGEHPGSPVLLLALSRALLDVGDLRGAERAARQVLAERPQSRSALEQLAVVLLRQPPAERAVPVLQQLIAAAPNEPNAWGLFALAGINMRRAGDQQTARDAYRRAIELDPQQARYRRYAAVVEHAYGNVWAARQHVVAGLELDPQSPELLAMHAAYAPVAEQPALLAHVLAANPDDAKSLEILDAAVTWERRVALAPLAGLPALAAALSVALPAAGTDVVLALGAALWLLLRRRLRARLAVLPAGYLAARAAAARWGVLVQRVLLTLCAAGLAAGGVAAWWSASLATLLLAIAAVAGLGAVVATLPDDIRVLARARRRSGRVWGGTAWRFGGLRQELVLWSGLAVGIVAFATLGPASGSGASGTDAAVAALAAAASLVVLLVESGNAAVNAPQRYLRTVLNRYRALAVVGMTIGLLVWASIAAAAGARPFVLPTHSPDDGTPRIRFPQPTAVPSLDLGDLGDLGTLTVSPLPTRSPHPG